MADEAISNVDAYSASQIRVLTGAEHIRLRPGMYIGDTGSNGLNHLIYELVYNCVDEALAGCCRHIDVELHADGGCSVSDDGRGIPVELHPEMGLSVLELVMTRFGSWTFEKGDYKVAAGLHGMGTKAVTALSEWVEVHIQRGGRTYVQQYKRGIATTPVKDIGPTNRTGTRVTFRPDPLIFSCLEFNFPTLRSRLEALAVARPQLHFLLTDHRFRLPLHEVIYLPSGVVAGLERVVHGWKPIHPTVLHGSIQADGMKAAIAFRWLLSEFSLIRSLANAAWTDRGTHVTGFFSGLTRSLRRGLPILQTEAVGGTRRRRPAPPTGEDLRAGLVAVLSVEIPNPCFAGATKDRLRNPEVEPLTARLTSRLVEAFVRDHPQEGEAVAKHLLDPPRIEA